MAMSAQVQRTLSSVIYMACQRDGSLQRSGLGLPELRCSRCRCGDGRVRKHGKTGAGRRVVARGSAAERCGRSGGSAWLCDERVRAVGRVRSTARRCGCMGAWPDECGLSGSSAWKRGATVQSVGWQRAVAGTGGCARCEARLGGTGGRAGDKGSMASQWTVGSGSGRGGGAATVAGAWALGWGGLWLSRASKSLCLGHPTAAFWWELRASCRVGVAIITHQDRRVPPPLPSARYPRPLPAQPVFGMPLSACNSLFADCLAPPSAPVF